MDEGPTYEVAKGGIKNENQNGNYHYYTVGFMGAYFRTMWRHRVFRWMGYSAEYVNDGINRNNNIPTKYAKGGDDK